MVITLKIKECFLYQPPNGGWYRSPKGVRSRDNLTRRVNRPRRAGQRKRKDAPAQNDLICSQNGQKLYAHACVRIKRSVTTPRRGVVYEPGSRRLTVRYEKKKLPLTNPEGVGMNTPMGCSYMFRGTPKGSPLNIPGPKVPVKKGLRSKLLIYAFGQK